MPNHSDTKYQLNMAYKEFDKFANIFNDIFNQFSLNVNLSRAGLIPKQDMYIDRNIYQPVFEFLSDPQWQKVNMEFKDAFEGYRMKKPQGYSSCITHAISGLQAYLQIMISGKTGQGQINKLIAKGIKNSIIPNDKFSKETFKAIESTLMTARQRHGDSHPKEEYANEENARLILNLIIVFMQHCIQHKPQSLLSSIP